MYKNKKIFILGMARSGYEVAKLLAKNNKVLVTDIKEQEEEMVKELEELGVSFKISTTPEQMLDNSYDVLIKNPGIKYNHSCVLKARELHIPVINEVEVAYKYLTNHVHIIGITGSNGKTTTAVLTYEILKKCFKDKVFLAGNIGIPLCHYINDIKTDDYLILEISDHQLCDMYDFKTEISVLTNIYECHTDFHDSHEKYKKIKKKIFNNHTKDDIAIINYLNKEEMNLTKDIMSTKYYFNNKNKCYIENNTIYYDNKELIEITNIPLKGNHNYENIMCAIMVAKEYNVPDKIIIEVINNFKGIEHRNEYVTSVNNRLFYNDSKSTNIESIKTALSCFNSPVILILGGLDRNHSFEALTPYLNNTKLVVCYGETKKRIKEYCDGIHLKCIVCNTLKEAVELAYDNSLELDTILFSPACASWDQFKDFEERGKKFKEYINDISKFDLFKYKHIFMIGIGGISMSGIAEILLHKGYKVSGSDRVESLLTDKLKDHGIKIYSPQAKENITKDIDLVVYTAAIKDDNIEIISAKEKNIPLMERGKFLGEITKLYSNTIGVSGTHGKTSTTSMLSCIFLEAKLDPTIQVGSILKNIDGNYRLGKSDNFIIEACEYCDSFLDFEQKSAIVLNIDNDHLDYFKNLDNIKKSFYKYVSKLPIDGYLVINNDDNNSNDLLKYTKAKIISYGIKNEADYMAKDIKYNSDGCGSYKLYQGNNLLGEIELSVPGEHNIANSLSTIALSLEYNIDLEIIKKGLLSYTGASRRLEYKGLFNGAKVYDDYGHHPTEVEATLNAIKKKKCNSSWVIFEGHTYSRVYEHMSKFAKILSNFDNIIITDIYAARENNIYDITPSDLIKEIKKYNKEAFYISDYEQIKEHLNKYAKKDDLILTLGAGNITKLADILTK